MHNKLAFICFNRVAAPCGTLVCPDCIGNIAGRANSTSTTGFVYKRVHYLIGTLCGEEKESEILAFHANRNALSAHVEKGLAELGISSLQWRRAFTGKSDVLSLYSTFNNAWLIRTKDYVCIVERPLNYASHIRLPAILWLLQRNLTIEEGHERVLQKDTTPDPKAVIAHAQVVKNSDNMRQIRQKSACT
ncbi:hypothetical protein D6C84_06063 [Aureobasidium pullulans]|uniref:Uncharacterized protein n=1 Tax=Aureobasidium pullulans TaxID=5580 RepID=A0A4S9XQG2_AURPU|nr:hypothetical protein D6C84_06063 [Aureobasidium pullulans]